MTEDKPWGPFGLGQWRGHPSVYCRVCGWPEYILWIDTMPPPGDCPDGHLLARACQRTLDRLMQNAWARAACGDKPPQAPIEMLRKVTGLTWEEIESMSDASGRGSHTIAEMRIETARAASKDAPGETTSGELVRGTDSLPRPKN